MAFALTSFFADGKQYNGPGPYYGTQTLQFTVTAAATDIDFDLGDYTGTFWTAAIANGTYGEMATQVLAFLQRIDGNALATKSVFTPEIAYRIQAAAASGTAYVLTLDTTSKLPIYLFDTATGETAYTVFVEWQLNTKQQPFTYAANIQV